MVPSHRPCSSIGVCLSRRSVSLISRSLAFIRFLCVFAPELEVGAVLPGGAVVCQPQEIARLRLALAPLSPAFGSVSAELKEGGLFRVQAERELGQAVLEVAQDTLRILPVLESNDCIVGIPHDDHIAPCVARAPLLDPEIVDVMEVHIRKQW